MITRRDFLKHSAYMVAAIKAGLVVPQAFASPNISAKHGKAIQGKIVAACYNLANKGPFYSEDNETVLSSLDLETGSVVQIPINLKKAHDALQVKDNFLVIPNKHSSKMHVTDLSGRGQDIFTRDNIGLKGHGFFDEQNDVIIVSAADLSEGLKGYFVLLDPKSFKVRDIMDLKGNAPHDIQLYDENTFAICNYNIDSLKSKDEVGYGKPPLGGYSEIALYDRKTLKLVDKIQAYKESLVSHSVMTDNGDLYAIGFEEYEDPTVAEWTNEYIEDKFRSYYAENHPELLKQWPDIAQSLKIHTREAGKKSFGLPLLPMKMEAGTRELDIMKFDNFHHRRAQSICYVRQTNTVAMSYPHSDSVQLYNATTGQSHDLFEADLNIKEMRGLTEIEGTTYLAIAGTTRGISIIDTRNFKVVNSYDVIMGSIIHMHHVV